MSYLGLQKDLSDPLSKKKSPYNQFLPSLKHFLAWGNDNNVEEIIKQNELILKLLEKLDNKPEVLTDQRINDLEKKLEEIRTQIKQVIG